MSAALLAPPLQAAPAGKPRKVEMIRPLPRPALKRDAAPAPPEKPIDLSRAVPGRAMASMPSSAEQFRALNQTLKTRAPQVAAAKRKSDALAAEAASLRRKLIDTAARIAQLETDRAAQIRRIAELKAEDERLSAGFARDRIAVTRLIAVLERLQHDMPPALVLRPDDALAAARGAMLIGASLPPVYARAAALSRRIEAMARTRRELAAGIAQGEATQASLGKARLELASLLAVKQNQADAAGGDYQRQQGELDAIARQAADFRTLLARIARLRRDGGGDKGVVMVEAAASGGAGGLARDSLRPPVAGTLLPSGSGAGGSGSGPGASFATLPGAQVVAPADGKVLFAGPYHKSGYVLILEITSGYDLVLAGLGQVTVRPNDELLAGEPVGTMPGEAGALAGGEGRLYFELRRDGKGLDPAPWLSLDLRKAKK